MSAIVVGVADCRLSADPGAVLVTYALGSCVAITIYDPVARVGGLLHFMLPESSLDPEKAAQKPQMFADTGIPLLFRQSYEMGAEKQRLIVRAAGGAQMMDDHGVFNIGKRNVLALRKVLWKAGVLLHGESVGGTDSRTVRMELGAGRMWWRGANGFEREVPCSRHAARGVKEWDTAS